MSPLFFSREGRALLNLQILSWATLVSKRGPFLWGKKVDSMSVSQPEQEAKGLDGAAKAFELPSDNMLHLKI